MVVESRGHDQATDHASIRPVLLCAPVCGPVLNYLNPQDELHLDPPCCPAMQAPCSRHWHVSSCVTQHLGRPKSLKPMYDSLALLCRPLWRTSSSSKSLRRVDSQPEAGTGAAAAGWGQERCADCMPKPGHA